MSSTPRRPKRESVLRIAVTREHLFWLRGLLIARERREVTFNELADRCGIPRLTMRHILARHYMGGERTMTRLLRLREIGLMIHVRDFALPNPESEQT